MRSLKFLAAVLAISLVVAGGLDAQTATAQINGTIADDSGAVIPGAGVSVTNQETGLTRETSTNESGDYTFLLLPVGLYSVTAQSDGFQAARRTDIRLNVNQTQRIDFSMVIGQVTETIEVAAGAVAIDTETSAVGHTVSQKQVTQLPLNGRNFLSLLFLAGGAVETNGEQGGMRQGAGNAISINGARPTSNNYLLDGTSNTDTALGTPAAILSIDAIQEFKEQTATYSAEYGFSANQINIVSKTGTNQLHGSVFHFLRNDKLDAGKFFNNLVGTPKNILRQNQFGFVVGGPAIKNKTFWLANYEGRRTRNSSQSFFNVPTPDQLASRFDSIVLDPQANDDPFPNSIIPVSRNARLSNLAIAKFIPAPNASSSRGNYIRQRSIPTDTDQFTIRVDQNMGKYGNVFGRYTSTDHTNIRLGNTTELGDIFFVQETRNWQVSHAVPIGTNVVNEFRFGYVRALANQNGATADQGDVDALGLTGVFTNLNDDQRSYPAVGFAGVGAGLSGGGSAGNDYQASNQPMWDISNATTWIRGNHTFKFGANFRQWSLQRDLANDFLGQFTYAGFFTGNGTQDHAVADMLLGHFSNVSVFQPAGFSVGDQAGNPRDFNFLYFAPFVQDDWKVTPRLTLNMGLRYDFRTVPNETNNRFGWRDLSNSQGGLVVADETLVSEGIVGDGTYYRAAGRKNPRDASRRVIAPRFGFAFRPFNDAKTVIRGGYGVFFDSAEGREIDGASDIYPYVSRGLYQQTFGQTAELITTDTMFPSFADLGPATPAANGFLAVSQSAEPINPYVQQWTLGVQRALDDSTSIEVNYIGTKGTHLLMRRNIAQSLAPGNPSLCDPSTNAVLNHDCPVLARRPFPNFGVYIDSDWGGVSSYHAANIKFEKRSSTMIFTSVYTWSKSLDTKSAAAGIGNAIAGWQGFLDNNDVRRDYGLSDFNVDHRLVTSFVYELPFGRGKKFLSNVSGAVNHILGGWQVNGIATFQKGFPMTVQAADLGGLNDTFGTNRANIIGDPEPSGFDRTIEEWFNTGAFTQPGFGVLGDSGRSIMSGPGINNFDTGLFKNFQIHEKLSVQLRFESFNAWNHTQWSLPNRNFADSRFGQISNTRDARINQMGLKILW
jgi:hypothetical protein